MRPEEMSNLDRRIAQLEGHELIKKLYSDLMVERVDGVMAVFDDGKEINLVHEQMPPPYELAYLKHRKRVT